MRITIHLEKIQQAYNEKAPINQQITMSVIFKTNLPLLTWECLTKLSLIVGLIKELFRPQSRSSYLYNIANMLQAVTREERAGIITRCWEKPAKFNTIKKPTSSPNAKL
jgi:hypothetical protein